MIHTTIEHASIHDRLYILTLDADETEHGLFHGHQIFIHAENNYSV